jgi:hypothetical protein
MRYSLPTAATRYHPLIRPFFPAPCQGFGHKWGTVIPGLRADALSLGFVPGVLSGCPGGSGGFRSCMVHNPGRQWHWSQRDRRELPGVKRSATPGIQSLSSRTSARCLQRKDSRGLQRFHHRGRRERKGPMAHHCRALPSPSCSYCESCPMHLRPYFPTLFMGVEAGTCRLDLDPPFVFPFSPSPPPLWRWKQGLCGLMCFGDKCISVCRDRRCFCGE